MAGGEEHLFVFETAAAVDTRCRISQSSVADNPKKPADLEESRYRRLTLAEDEELAVQMDRQEILGQIRFVVTIAKVKPGETLTVSQTCQSWTPRWELGIQESYLATASGARRLWAWLQQPTTQLLGPPPVSDPLLPMVTTVSVVLVVSWVALPRSVSIFRWAIDLFSSSPDELSQAGDGILWTFDFLVIFHLLLLRLQYNLGAVYLPPLFNFRSRPQHCGLPGVLFVRTHLPILVQWDICDKSFITQAYLSRGI